MDRDSDDGQLAPAAGAGDLLDTSRAAQVLGVSTSTVNRWARNGLVWHVRRGHKRLYDPALLRRPAPSLSGHRPDRRDEELWTTGAVAERLGISQALVRRLAASGELAARTTPSGRWRFSRGAVEQYVLTLPLDPVDTVALNRAAAVLGVSPRTIKRWADRGRVELHRGLSGAACVRRDDLARLAQQLPERLVESRDPDTLTTRDVAVLMGRSEEWVRQRAQKGLIPSRRTAGGRRRFRAVDLPSSG